MALTNLLLELFDALLELTQPNLEFCPVDGCPGPSCRSGFGARSSRPPRCGGAGAPGRAPAVGAAWAQTGRAKSSAHAKMANAHGTFVNTFGPPARRRERPSTEPGASRGPPGRARDARSRAFTRTTGAERG